MTVVTHLNSRAISSTGTPPSAAESVSLDTGRASMPRTLVTNAPVHFLGGFNALIGRLMRPIIAEMRFMSRI
jgi:hypothetical protein